MFGVFRKRRRILSNSKALLKAVARWGPVAVSLLAFLAALAYTRSLPLFSGRYVLLAAGAGAWFATSLWATAPRRSSLLADRLARTSRETRLLLVAAALISAWLAVRGEIVLCALPAVLAAAQFLAASEHLLPGPASYAIVAALTLLLSEGTLVLIHDAQALSRFALVRLIGQELYFNNMTAIQYLEECAEYDAELSYTLRPGRCRFANVEFDTAYQINSLGVRDDEASLRKPEIIAIGDSYTMGWGVEGNETFASRLEQMSGRKVLNAGVSSYATVRELLLLKRIDMTAARCLLLQYNALTDYGENRTYMRNDGTLPIRNRGAYESTARLHAGFRRYYPGKYVYTLLKPRLLWPMLDSLESLGWPPADRRSLPHVDPHRDSAKEVEAFLFVFEHAPVDLFGLKVIVFQVDPLPPEGKELPFTTRLREVLASDARLRERFRLVDLKDDLTARDYFTLDTHINASGHEKIARRLLRLIEAAPN